MRLAVDSNLAFLHTFQQTWLGAVNGAVDLVGQEQVGYDGTRSEAKLAGRLLVGFCKGQNIMTILFTLICNDIMLITLYLLGIYP